MTDDPFDALNACSGQAIRLPNFSRRLSRFDVLIKPQQIDGVILFLDLCQTTVVGSVSRSHKLFASFT